MLREAHRESRRFKHVDRSDCSFRMEVVIESVRPEKNCRGGRTRSVAASFLEPIPEALVCEARNSALAGNPCGGFGYFAQPRRLGQKIRQPRGEGSDSRPDVDVSECVMSQRMNAAFIVMGKELGFVSCDVHCDWAVAFAAFAREAEIER